MNLVNGGLRNKGVQPRYRLCIAAAVFWWLLGMGLALGVAGLLSWGFPPKIKPWEVPGLTLGAAAAYLVSMKIGLRIPDFDLKHSGILSAVGASLLVFALFSATLLLTRMYYSRTFLITVMLITLVWVVATRLLQTSQGRPIFAYMPGQIDESIFPVSKNAWARLESAQLPDFSVDGVVVDFSTEDRDWQRLIADCGARGIPLLSGGAVYEATFGRVSLRNLSNTARDFHPHPIYAPFKRVLDVLGAMVLLVATWPVMVLTGIAIRLESPGPVLFSQQRVGQGEKPFRMFKFRSMVVNADWMGAQFAQAGDRRVTRVGQVIRRWRIDELPQLWNVLKGDMSLIGPRPEQIEFVKRFKEEIPFYGYRHLVRPGLTGWAQVSLGYAACVESTRQKLEYDLYYAKHCSPWLDLLIALRTFRILATGFGAR